MNGAAVVDDDGVVAAAPIAYSFKAAAAAVGQSETTIKRAVRAGDLPVVAGTIEGRSIARPVILGSDLREWLRPVGGRDV